MDCAHGGADPHYQREDANLAEVLTLTNYLIPGEPAIQVTAIPDNDLQCQWNLLELLKNLFKTTDSEALLGHFKNRMGSVTDFHFRLWPGYVLPEILRTKHQTSDEVEQKVFLKKKTVPTSIAFAWVVWAVGHTKRDISLRKKSWKFLAQLFEHSLEQAGRLGFRVKCVGDAGAPDRTCAVNMHNPTVSAQLLWKPAVQRQLLLEWESRRLDESHFISSVMDRPKLLDVIYFGLTVGGDAGNLLTPLAETILAQFAGWLDEHFQVIALEVSGFQDSRLKNRLAKQDALTHALWEAINFFLHENDLWHLLERFRLRMFVYWFLFIC